MPQQGDDFGSYVAARSGALLRTAYLLTGNRQDAEDLLQTALAKTYLAWHRIQDKAAADGYVRRVLVNTQTSWWRKRKVDEYPTEDLPEQPGYDVLRDHDLRDTMWTALGRLPRRQRAMVVLRYYEDLTEAETAAVLGVSIGTVKSSVSRALAKLRQDDALLDHDATRGTADLPATAGQPPAVPGPAAIPPARAATATKAGRLRAYPGLAAREVGPPVAPEEV